MRARRAAMLHTVPALAATFHSMLQDELPDVEIVHVVDPWLLATAIDIGVTDDVLERVARHVEYLADLGSDAVLVTCSSIGEAVDAAASSVPIPLIRVDAPMSRQAASIAAAAGERQRRAGRVVVLATLSATLGPTGRLLDSGARAGARELDVIQRVVDGAVAARDRRDQGEHDRLVREAALSAADEADVIVLAQASMAGALDGSALTVPVLTSPAGGVAELVAALRDSVAEGAAD